MTKNLLLLISVLSISISAISQPISANLIDTSNTSLIAGYLGNQCTSISNIQYTGDTISIGEFNDSYGDFPFSSGLVLSNGEAYDVAGPNTIYNTGYNTTGGSDSLLATLVPYPIYDAARLEYTFTSNLHEYELEYVYGSEEYPATSGAYIDYIGIFVSGPNPNGGFYNNVNFAVLPGTNTPVNCISVNQNINTNLYNFSQHGASNNAVTQMNGYTVLMHANIDIIPGETYTVKVIIADSNDAVYDSAIFFRSKTSALPAPEYDINSCGIANTLVSFNPLYDYLWDNGTTNSYFFVQNPGIYYVTVTSGGCTAVDSVNLILANYPIATLDSITSSCNDIITLSAGEAENYFWSLNHSDQEFSITQNNPGMYYVTMSNGPCITIDSTEVIFNDFTPFDLGNDGIFCEGETLTLETNIWGDHIWNNGSTQPSLEVTEAGTYSVEVINEFGCSSFDTINLSLVLQPIASFTFTNNNGWVILTNTSQNANSYLWNFGDGSASSTAINATHQYLQQQDDAYYYITLSATNVCSTNSTDTIILILDIESEIYSPKISLYPNPTSDFIYINNDNYSITDIKIKNNIGQLIDIQPFNNSILNLESYANGLYYIEFTANKRTHTYRIIKQ